MPKNNICRIVLILIAFFCLKKSSAQGITDWDNQLFIGNKVATNKGQWRYSGELQIRLIENAKALDQWFF